MRPTFSIIFFTVLSGAGYGLWILTGLALVSPWPECARALGEASAAANCATFSSAQALCAMAIGFVLVSAGLLSSLGHLGQPQRAWRALSQWRSSWLSREGVAALLTYVPAAVVAFLLLQQVLLARACEPAAARACLSPYPATTIRLLAGALVIGSLVTIICTANIYACLKPIRAWHNRHVVAGYLLLGIYSGGLLAWALATVPPGDLFDLHLILAGLILTAVAGAILKFSYWRFVDRDEPATTADAIGLASLGTIRSFEHPHTEANYLTHEMGFRLARKHSRKLRGIALLAGFLIPATLAMLAGFVPSIGPVAAWLALAFGMLGIFVERWLFFAEARHMVMLYYGSRSA